jgi:hypothetical protein
MQPTYAAAFRNLDLAVHELNNDSESQWLWTVINRETGETVAQGERPDRESAMVEAAEAAKSDWGTVRWRRPGDEDE